MKKKWTWSKIVLATAVGLLAVLMLSVGSLSIADHKGKPHGKPGGGGEEPSNLPPVRYETTKVTGTFLVFGTNEAGAMVGKGSALDPRNGSAAAYLPWCSEYQTVDLNSLNLLAGTDWKTDTDWAEWHLRTALGINNKGGIVGNMEPDDPEVDLKRAFYLDTSTMTVTELGPFDPDAVYEHAMCINDSGDIVVVSDGTMYVGNPGLYGNDPIPFEKVIIDFLLIDYVPSDGATLEVLARYGDVEISNRIKDELDQDKEFPAFIVGNIDDGPSGSYSRKSVGFRMTTDQSFFESASYEDSSGNRYGIYIYDINDLGDAAGGGREVYAKKYRGYSFRRFGAIWRLGETQIDEAIPGVNVVWINNDGDAVAGHPHSDLLHNTASEAYGVLDIPSLILPDDPNRNFFVLAIELTDGVPIADPNSTDPLDFWPVIIAQGEETVDGVTEAFFLILEPVAFP